MVAWLIRLAALPAQRAPVVARNVALFYIAMALLVAGLTAFPDAMVFLLGESGFLEAGSVAWFFVVSLAGLVVATAAPGSRTRWLAVWLGWMGLLAGLRELDLHIRLNPKHLGEWGVRYRIDWWLNGQVPAKIKLVWFTVFCVVAWLSLVPVWRVRAELVRLIRSRALPLACLPIGLGCVALGVVIDDPLRNVTVVSKQTKSLVEEGTEWFGAALICAGSLSLMRAQYEEERQRMREGAVRSV